MDNAQIESLYCSKPVNKGISVATVADFVDSFENIHDLAVAAGDLKDVQRPWTLKTILGTVPPGSSVCEIGAGEPIVADMLSQLGYKVTIVDPYDGSGNGPTALQYYMEKYPHIRILNQHFNQDLPDVKEGAFDAIYSISVLEHLNNDALTEVVAGMNKFLKTGGRQIHAIDFVAAGAGAQFHRQKVEFFLHHFDISPEQIENLMQHAMNDTETYFLSAESHNRWRGKVPYESFPMRKVISVQCVF